MYQLNAKDLIIRMAIIQVLVRLNIMQHDYNYDDTTTYIRIAQMWSFRELKREEMINQWLKKITEEECDKTYTLKIWWRDED